MGELFGAKHGFSGGIGGKRLGWGTISTGIHEEEGAGSVHEFEVGCSRAYGWGVYRGVVKTPGVGCCRVGSGSVAIPIIRYLVVI